LKKRLLPTWNALMDDEAVGVSTVESMTVVPKERLSDELHELGNDGSFFDSEM